MSTQPRLGPNGDDPASGASSNTIHDSPTLEPHHKHAVPDEEGDSSDRMHDESDSPTEHNRSNSLHRLPTASTVKSTKATRDPELDLSLPYRTLTDGANMEQYRVETRQGEIPGPPRKDGELGDRYRMVTFEPNDKDNPKNWSLAMKWYCTFVVAITCLVVALNSSIISADVGAVAEEFGQSEQLTLASISLFVMGFGVGPMAFAPLSEIYGRRIIYASTLFLAWVFVIPCAVSKNIETLLVCRAIDGIAFSAPMTLVGGTLADLWRNEERGVPMAVFSAAPFMGPALGPLIGGFVADNAGWRWLYWLQLIMSFVVWVMISFTIPETYAPTILARRAKKLRKETGDQSWATEQDLDMRPMSERLRIFLLRPFQLLFAEIIVLLISLYMAVLYGLLYMFFVAYPIVYEEGKGWSASMTGLMFIPIAVGTVASAACSPLVNKHYLKMVEKYNGDPPAEVRLVPMMISCWCIPIGLFIFAWTSYPRLVWVGPCLAGFPVGFGFIFLYNSANNYLVDCYQHQAASALAAKTFIRSFWGAACVLFTGHMYNRLGYQWASTLLAFLALACCAIPFGFYYFGARIRKRSKYAFSPTVDNGAGDEEKGNAN